MGVLSFHLCAPGVRQYYGGVEAVAANQYPEPDVYISQRKELRRRIAHVLVQQRLPESSGSNELGNCLTQ